MLPSIQCFATAIVKKLVDAGYVTYFAGGWVRDFLMKHPSDDIDIATSAPIEVIQALFPHTIPVGVAFGILIVVEGGHHFEVATFRKEGGYYDGRRPTTIQRATPQEDALRRDFTINGMFWDPLTEQLFDYVGGQEDLKKGIIRAIGNPHERFYEDRLRMMRAVRYSTRFNFPIDRQTRQAILDHADALLPAVAIERIWQEFKKMAQFAHFGKGLARLHELQLLQTIFPRLKEIPLKEIQKKTAVLELFPKNAPPIAQLIELFDTDSLEQYLELCMYLKLSNQEKALVEFLYHAKMLLQIPWSEKLEKIEWAYFYAHPHYELALHIRSAHLDPSEKKIFLQNHARQKEELSRSIDRITQKKPLITAERLIREGITPGEKMGLLLKEAERISINADLEDPELIIQQLKNSSLWSHV